MKRTSWLAAVCAVALATLSLAPAAPIAAVKDVDEAFRAFWAAHNPQDAEKQAREVIASGVSFDEAFNRLKSGRPYAGDVARGVVKTSYRAHNREFFYSIDVPPSYDPTRRYQVRMQLHGGVSRPSNQPRGNGSIGNLASPTEQIYILPIGWEDAEWWTTVQLDNLRTILDSVKRSYNVDENRVVLAGVSDGGTGVYYMAMHDATPFASFTSFIGFIMVLDSVDGAGEQFPNNLRNKPWFVVNDGMDPLYPTRIVTPYVEHLKKSGVDLTYLPQPNAGHNTSWWPDVKDTYDAWVRSHPRNPLPDVLTWESTLKDADTRAHWLVIDKLALMHNMPPLDDVNRTGEGRMLFEHRKLSGRVDVARVGNLVKAQTRGVGAFTLLLSPDMFDFSRPIRVETNGNLAFEGLVQKSVSTLLTWAARDNDRTMLFGAELHVEVK